MSRRNTGTLGCTLAALLVIGACSAPQQQAAPAPAPAPAAPTPPVVKMPVSINAAMVRLVDHSAHDLWDLERAGRQPKTEKDWEDAEHHATQMVLAAATIRLEGTGPQDRLWVSDEKWHSAAQAMSEASRAALTAAEARNFDGLVAANGQLVEACEACHKAFKPALPSEGILHPHVH